MPCFAELDHVRARPFHCDHAQYSARKFTGEAATGNPISYVPIAALVSITIIHIEAVGVHSAALSSVVIACIIGVDYRLTALTIAAIPARTASGSPAHAAITASRSGSESLVFDSLVQPVVQRASAESEKTPFSVRECGSVALERLLDTQEVTGSSPVSPSGK